MLILFPTSKYFFSSAHWDPWGRDHRLNPGSAETNDEAIIDFIGFKILTDIFINGLWRNKALGLHEEQIL